MIFDGYLDPCGLSKDRGVVEDLKRSQEELAARLRVSTDEQSARLQRLEGQVEEALTFVRRVRSSWLLRFRRGVVSLFQR